MSKVLVTEELQASAQTVWELVREFDGIAKWVGPMVQNMTVEGEGVGAIRTIALPGDTKLQEQLKAYDEEGRSFDYAIIGDGPLPASEYLATITIVETGPNTCRIDWGSSFEPKGPEAEVVPMIEGIYKAGIAGIKTALGL